MVKAESARPEACDGRGGGEDEVVFPPLVDNEEAVLALHRRRDPVIDARVLGAARRSYAEFGWAAFHFDRVAKGAQSAGTFSTGGMLIVRRCCSKRWPTRYLLTTDGDEPFSDGSEMPTAHAANGSRPPKHVVAPSRYSPSKRASCSRACSPAHAPPSPYYRIVIYTSACVAREHLCARLEDVSPGIQGAMVPAASPSEAGSRAHRPVGLDRERAATPDQGTGSGAHRYSAQIEFTSPSKLSIRHDVNTAQRSRRYLAVLGWMFSSRAHALIENPLAA